jgi:hypothetical protein
LGLDKDWQFAAFCETNTFIWPKTRQATNSACSLPKFALLRRPADHRSDLRYENTRMGVWLWRDRDCQATRLLSRSDLQGAERRVARKIARSQLACRSLVLLLFLLGQWVLSVFKPQCPKLNFEVS